MKELTRTRRLTISSILFILIIIIGFITFRKPVYKYQITTSQMIEELFDIENETIPDPGMEWLEFGEAGLVMVDVRNPNIYMKGHLGAAVNIPVSDILKKEQMAFFKQMELDSMTVILYGANQREANGPWMLLKQLGFNNVTFLMGGYEYLMDSEIDFYDMPDVPTYLVEEPIVDFAQFIADARNNTGNMNNQTITKKNVVPIKKRVKKTVAEGGC